MEENKSLFGLQVDADANANLHEVSRWAKFLAIVVFCAMGLLLLFLLAFGARIAEAFSSILEFEVSGIMGVFIVIMVLIVGIVVTLMYFLLRGANGIRKGLQNNDQPSFNDGLSSMRIYFVFYGVLSILSVVFSLIALF